MPQDEIKPLNTKDTGEGRKVRPKEDTVVYSTGQSKNLGVAGTKHTMHAVMAEKLADKGFVSLDEPEVKKEVKLTKAEMTALERRLGHKPTADEIAEAVKEKEDEL